MQCQEKCHDKIQLWFRLLFQFLITSSFHNPNPAFLDFFTTVVLMKHRSLDLLSWLAKESLDSTCIIYSCLKYSLFLCKIFRVCCAASRNASPDRCKMRFPSPSLCSDAELPWWFHEWPWKTRLSIKQLSGKELPTPSLLPCDTSVWV